jgi:hypothetical protein
LFFIAVSLEFGLTGRAAYPRPALRWKKGGSLIVEGEITPDKDKSPVLPLNGIWFMGIPRESRHRPIDLQGENVSGVYLGR